MSEIHSSWFQALEIIVFLIFNYLNFKRDKNGNFKKEVKSSLNITPWPL